MSNDEQRGGFLQGAASFTDASAGSGGGSDAFPGSGGDSFTETQHVSWGQKLMDSIVGVGIGLVLVAAMSVLLFWNEGRAVQTYRSLDEGASVVVKAEAARVDPANEGKLVHLQGDLTAEAPVADAALGIQTRAARLVRHVEMFQWKEDRRTETRKNLGGSEERVTTYSYSRVWEDKRIDSSRFHNSNGHQNPQMRFGQFEATARDARLGAYRPGGPALSRIPASEAKPIPSEAASRFEGRADLGPAHVVDGALYLGSDPSEPRVGDLRISYKIAPLGQTSFIGRQVGTDLQSYQTKAGDALLLARSGAAAPEAMFAQARDDNRTLTWILRAVGTIFMFAGFALILRPLAVLGDVVPIIGSILGAGTGLVALLLTMLVAPLVIAIAWFFFRPLVSFAILAVAVAVIVGLRRLALRRRAARGGSFASGTVPAGMRR